MIPTDQHIVALDQGGYAVYTEDGCEWSWHSTLRDAKAAAGIGAPTVQTDGAQTAAAADTARASHHAAPLPQEAAVATPGSLLLTERERYVALIFASGLLAACAVALRARRTREHADAEQRVLLALLRALRHAVPGDPAEAPRAAAQALCKRPLSARRRVRICSRSEPSRLTLPVGTSSAMLA